MGEDGSSLFAIPPILEAYKQRFPSESERLSYFREFLREHASFERACLRQNYIGHITASALILSRKTGRVLLVYKPALSMHLQPGGHIIAEDKCTLHAAVRHLYWRLPQAFVERLEYVQCDYDPVVPIDIDTHLVPQSPQDGEPAHSHFDFRYLFFGEEDALSMDNDIIRKSKPRWHSLDHLRTHRSFDNLVRKLQKLATPHMRSRRFFASLLNTIQLPSVSTIVVAHMIPDVIEYLQALSKTSSLRGVIAKPRSIDPSVIERLKADGFEIVRHARDSHTLRNYLDCKIAESASPVVLMDVGGWFTPLVSDFAKIHGERLLGVIEDTENGLQK